MPYTYPRQLKGIGMSRMASNQEIENSYFLDTNRQAVDQLLATNNAWDRQQFVARITASAALQSIGGNPVRWTYSLTRQVFPATTNLYDPTMADPDALLLTGYNLYEWYHSSGTLGDGVDYASLPVGTTLAPIAGIVMITSYRVVNANTTDIVYLFDRNNGYVCPEGEG